MSGIFPLVKVDANASAAVCDYPVYGVIFKYELIDANGNSVYCGPHLDNPDERTKAHILEFHESGSINVWSGTLNSITPVCLPEYLNSHHNMTGIETDENRVLCKDPDGNIIQCLKNPDGTFYAYRQGITADDESRYEVDLAKCNVMLRVNVKGF